MKKTEMKRLLKPIVEECVREAIIESGVIAQVVSEVLKGTLPMLTERKVEQRTAEKKQEPKRPNISEAIRKEVREITQNSYSGLDTEKFNIGGVNVFEGVKPVVAENKNVADPLRGTDPSDPGVDISKLFKFGKN